MFNFGTFSSAKGATVYRDVNLGSDRLDRLRSIRGAYKLPSDAVLSDGGVGVVIRDKLSPCVVPFGTIFDSFGGLLLPNQPSKVYLAAAARTLDLTKNQVQFTVSGGGVFDFGRDHPPEVSTRVAQSLVATLELGVLASALTHGLFDKRTPLPQKAEDALFEILNQAERVRVDRPTFISH